MQKVDMIYSGVGSTQDHERLERLTLGIKELLDICAENKIEVPDDLKQSLLGNIDETCCATQAEYLAEKHKERVESEVDKGVFAEVQAINKKLKSEFFPTNVNVKNGSYTVNNYYSDDISPFKKDDLDSSSTHRAKQKIHTVQTESPVFKLFQCIMKCFLNNGDIRSRKEEKVIMEGIDLALESGKMYLIL
jgi:hypothetical protein